MTTLETNASRLHALANEASAQLTDASGEHSARNHEHNGLWTNGYPDPVLINQRRQQLLQEYANRPQPAFGVDQFRYMHFYAELKYAQALFYAEMHYLDDLLYAAPVLPLPVESTTTIVPYEPAQPRRRGRPSTGGRKPKPTTRAGRRKETD